MFILQDKYLLGFVDRKWWRSENVCDGRVVNVLKIIEIFPQKSESCSQRSFWIFSTNISCSFDGSIPTAVMAEWLKPCTCYLVQYPLTCSIPVRCTHYNSSVKKTKTLFLEKDGDITTFVIPDCLRLIHEIWWVILSKVRILYTALDFILQYQYILSFVVRKCRWCNDACGSQMLLVLD